LSFSIMIAKRFFWCQLFGWKIKVFLAVVVLAGASVAVPAAEPRAVLDRFLARVASRI